MKWDADKRRSPQIKKDQNPILFFLIIEGVLICFFCVHLRPIKKRGFEYG